MEFWNVVAWVFGILSTLLVIGRILSYYTYTDEDRMIDALNTENVAFSLFYPGIVAIICWAWIITGGV